MDPDGLPVIGSGVDYTQVGAIHQKRTLAFINYFVTSTVSFLNNFGRTCEVKLQKCESRIQKLEASLGILEAKLTSIPGLDEVKADTKDNSSNSIPLEQSSTNEVPVQIPASEEVDVETIPETSDMPTMPSGMILVKDDPAYSKFFRMLRVGVPERAVMLKMAAEGLDPDMLRNPDQPVPESEKNQTEGIQSQNSDSGTD